MNKRRRRRTLVLSPPSTSSIRALRPSSPPPYNPLSWYLGVKDPARRRTTTLSQVRPAPATIFCYEWRGLAPDLAARCEHQSVCEKFVSFDSVDSGRRFLACAQKEIPKCTYVEWVDPEWPATLKMSLARIWGMYEDENKLRLRQNVVNAKETLRYWERRKRWKKI
ncbi:uncharacterized protein [Triticum aestivum]|uniref:uncharacterized protein n=1 Tax=Triticum aestivum TaxID=4565 RepID=UPI001D00BBF9|nr:uncharacterized protein LOC123078189 [Triticum aestivum]